VSTVLDNSLSLPFFWRLSGETFVEGRVSLADVSEFVWHLQVEMYVRKYLHTYTCCTHLCMDAYSMWHVCMSVCMCAAPPLPLPPACLPQYCQQIMRFCILYCFARLDSPLPPSLFCKMQANQSHAPKLHGGPDADKSPPWWLALDCFGAPVHVLTRFRLRSLNVPFLWRDDGKPSHMACDRSNCPALLM